MLGYCGIYCFDCSVYKGTVTNDMSLLSKLAKEYNSSEKDWVCLGCQPAGQLFLSKYCSTCEIRACAINNKVQNRAACEKFENCSKLQIFINDESDEIVHRMKMLREQFINRQSQK